MIWVAHRYVLRLRLAPRSSAEHVLGWRVVTSAPDALQLEAVSSLLGRGLVVGERPEPTRSVVTTYVFFARPVLSRAIWTAISPLHRWVVPYLMERAAGTAGSQ